MTPREAFLEEENELLKKKIKYLEHLNNNYTGYYSTTEEPKEIFVDDITKDLKLIGEGVLENEIDGCHIIAKSYTGNKLSLGYYISNTIIESNIDPIKTLYHIYNSIFKELQKYYRK